MNMPTFDISKLKSFLGGLLATGKKNAPTLMTGGGIVLGWIGVYLFWKESRKAEEQISLREDELNAGADPDISEGDIKKLPKSEKFVYYLRYCWLSLACGLVSTGLTICGHKLTLDRLAEAALIAKYMTNKNEDQKKVIEKLKKEVSPTKAREIENDAWHENRDESEIIAELRHMIDIGDTRTLFIDEMTGRHFKAEREAVNRGLADFNQEMAKRRDEAMKEAMRRYRREHNPMNDPFFVSESPHGYQEEPADDEDLEEAIDGVYSTMKVSSLLYLMGETSGRETIKIAENFEFRFDGHNFVREDDIFTYDQTYKRNYFNPEDNVPPVCRIDYEAYIMPSYDLIERDML